MTSVRDAFRVCDSARRALRNGHIDLDTYGLVVHSTRDLSPSGWLGWNAVYTLDLEQRVGPAWRPTPMSGHLASLR